MAEAANRADGLRHASAEEPEDSKGILSALRTIHGHCCKEKETSVVDVGLIEPIDFDGERVTPLHLGPVPRRSYAHRSSQPAPSRPGFFG